METNESLPAHLDRVVSAHASAPAVVGPDAQLTYAELQTQACNVAATLEGLALRAGVDGDHRVGVLIEHSTASIVATLGVLKAGAAVVPLDPGWPRDRLLWTIETCAPSAMLTSERLHDLARRLAPDRPTVTAREYVDRADWTSDSPIRPDSPAFVLTTSGTTGRPKAVIDLHQNIVHEATRLKPSLQLAPGDRQTVLRANCAGAVSDVFTALLAGATVLPFDAISETHGSFSEWLEGHRPTVWRSAPSLFRTLFADLAPELVPELRVVFLCGEPSFGSDLELFRRTTRDHCVLLNCYGTTETATASVARFGHDAAPVHGGLTIGEPVIDMEIALVDPRGQTVHGRGEGQLVVRSPYLAAGYLGEPSSSNGGFELVGGHRRQYATADIGERRADGTIVSLHRVDATALSVQPARGPSTNASDDPIGGQLAWNGKRLRDANQETSVSLEVQLTGIWASLLDTPSAGPDDNFFELGGTSLLAIECCIELERQLSLAIAPALLLESPTPASLAARIEAEADAGPVRAIVPMRSGGDAPALFVVHGEGGEVFVWAELSRVLPKDRPVIGVQALLEQDGSPVHESTVEMAAHYVREIRAIQPSGPYHLCGISAGGRLAWAIAERLRTENAEVGLLAIIETGAVPDLSWLQYPHRKLPLATRLRAGRVVRALGFRQPPNGSAPLDPFGVMLRAHKRGPIDCDVDLFVGETGDPKLIRNAWRRHTSGHVEMHTVAGRHVSILRAPHVEVLAERLAGLLAKR